MHIPLKMIWKIITVYSYRITFRRIWNLILVGLSLGLSKLLKRPVVWGKPALLMVEPTNLCNLHCPMCPSGAGEMTRQKGKMDVEAFKDTLDTLAPTLILIQFWNQGEPFVHPDFLEMVAYAKSKHIPAMTSTNGHFIRSEADAAAIIDSGLDEILISVDGLDQTSYETYRVGGSYQTVLDGIRLLVKVRLAKKSKKPLINLQFLVFKHNETQQPDLIALARDLGADIVALKSAQVYGEDQAETFLPQEERFRRYRYDGKKLRLKASAGNGCQFLWHGTVLNWDGSVTPCCFDKDGDFTMGNVFAPETTYLQIWFGTRFMAFRRKLLTDRAGLPMCANCFEGLNQPYVFYTVL